MTDEANTIWPVDSMSLPAENEMRPESSAEVSALDDIPDYPAPLASSAFLGPLGEHVRLVSPHTEADPSAILLHELVLFGNCVNRSSFLRLGRIDASPNINVAIIGPTSTGRKGTAGFEARRLFAEVDGNWEKTRIKTGASSGEGISEQVCDPQYEKKERRKNGEVFESEEVLVKQGAQDKRLVVYETEFSRTLRAAAREGSTLTAVLRQAFDGDQLCVMTKKETIASNVHVSVIAHITREELLRVLSDIDMCNGFSNRFLWACSKRSHLLPRGGEIQEGDARLDRIVRDVCEGVRFARTGGELRFDEQALDRWDSEYPKLTAERNGLLGAVLSRAATLVMRLSLIFALSTRSKAVSVQHLEAALEIWRYCEASAKFIFGDRTGDPIADLIMAELRKDAEGLSRTQISDLFAGNKSKSAIEFALRTLAMSGAISRTSVSSGKGRPVERWVPTIQLQARGAVQ